VWRLQASLAGKLFLSYLLVVLVGTITLLVTAAAVAPAFFDQQMQRMMEGSGGVMGGPGGMMGQAAASIEAAFRDALMSSLMLAVLLATITAVLASLFVARQISRPVHRMLVAARRIGAGHYAERVVVPPANAGDELGQLADSFNDMAASLEQTERQRLELVGDVAHELRTPIATLEGYLEGLLDGVVEPNERTWATLHAEAGRLRRLVDDLQELSRAEARQVWLRLVVVNPGRIAEAAAERLRAQFDEKGFSLTATIPDNLPPVRCDQDRAVQVLTNLLTNALRYTPVPGRVEIALEWAGDRVAFRVRDTGVGLSPEQLAHVFDRFYRVDKSRSRAVGGSGIGLTIAKALAEAMGGRLTAQSPGLGRGSTFTFSLPVAR
jgi:signal transduction histidine kinase